MPSIAETIKLDRTDLTGFPKETADLILQMQKEGWGAYRNRQGHVKLLSPDGEDYVMATQNPNSPTYVRSGYNKYNKKHGKVEIVVTEEKVKQKWPCARPGCPKTYMDEEHLNRHIAVDHEGMQPCPDCLETRKTKQALSIHRTNVHGYESPRKARRKELEANRKGKTKIVLTPEAIEELRGSERPISLTEYKLPTPDEPKLDGPLPDYLVKADGTTIDMKTSEVLEAKAAVKTEDISFIDERDSWTLDIGRVRGETVSDLINVYKAAGLEMEIRVWKP